MNLIEEIRQTRPLIQCITNIVTVNDCANVLLALGASPTMAQAPEEAKEVASKADAVVLNMGATECAQAMMLAGSTAHELGKVVVLDPVGVAGSTYRRNLALDIIKAVSPDCIRGNYSEIRALYELENTGAGVDASEDDSLKEIELIAESLARKYEMIVVASGEVDIVSDGRKTIQVAGGSTMMKKITGAGCMASCLMGAFMAAGDKCFEAAAECSAFFKKCGEAAEEKTLANNEGSMSFCIRLIDQVSL